MAGKQAKTLTKQQLAAALRRAGRSRYGDRDRAIILLSAKASILDALSSHICVIDKDGVIVAVNRAWQDFTDENPPLQLVPVWGRTILRFVKVRRGPTPKMRRNSLWACSRFSRARPGRFRWNIPAIRRQKTDGSQGTLLR
jgi:PAS domain-containing protein